MNVRVSNLAALSAMSLALAALTACSPPQPDYAPPPPPPAAAYDPAPVELAGAATPGQDGLAGGPAAAAPATASMAPIPNPEDLPPAERHRIYGTKYDGDQPAIREGRVPARRPERAYADTPPRRAAAPPRPVAATRPTVAANAPAAPKPVARAPAAKPAPPVATTAATPLDPKLAKLQAALAPQVSAGAAMTVAAPLSQRLEGPVVLTLPQTLFDVIGQEAAKLGLGRAARTAEVSATLSGEGYDITPNGPQTARLKSGEATSFEWQVRPGGGALGPLSAQIDAALRGQRPAMTFPLGTITKAAPETAEDRKSGFNLGQLNMGAVDVPGIGRMRGETLVGGGLLLMALLALIAIARNISEAEARARLRRRKAAENSQTETAPMEAATDGAADAKAKSRPTKKP